MRAAIVESDRITNLVEAESLASIAGMFPEAIDASTLPEGVGIGWTRDGDQWIAPPAPPPAPVRIDTPLFIMRFTPEERIAMRTMAASGSESAPFVQDWLEVLYDPRLAYVELGDLNLLRAIGMMILLGLLSQERADFILTP